MSARARMQGVLGVMAICLRLTVAATLLVAGGIHLVHLAAFVHAITGYHLLAGGAAFAAVIIAPLEAVAGLALASGVLRRGGAVIAAALLLIFAAALLQAWIRGIDVRCGCFGALAEAAPRWALLRDLALLLALAASTWCEARSAAGRAPSSFLSSLLHFLHSGPRRAHS